MADGLTHKRGQTQERTQTHKVDWLTHHHNQEGTPAHKVEWLAFKHSLTQDGTYVPTAIVHQEDHTPPQNVSENE